MHIQHNFLRKCRKQSHLNQSDLAFIMQLPDSSNLSRWEQGKRLPNIEVLMAYHLLFDIPVESLFERQKHPIAEILIKRIQLLLDKLRTSGPSNKSGERIRFLESVLKRLTN